MEIMNTAWNLIVSADAWQNWNKKWDKQTVVILHKQYFEAKKSLAQEKNLEAFIIYLIKVLIEWQVIKEKIKQRKLILSPHW